MATPSDGERGVRQTYGVKTLLAILIYLKHELTLLLNILGSRTARMWKHGIHAFLKRTERRLTDVLASMAFRVPDNGTAFSRLYLARGHLD